MNEFIQLLQATFGTLVLIFTVSNLGAMGLRVKMPEVVAALRNKKAMALIFVWGWVLGPALGYLITRVLPLAEPYVVVVLLASLAPCAPFLQQMVSKAGGDIGFAGALIPLVAVGTVVLMPVVRHVILECPAVNTIDASGLESQEAINRRLKDGGITFHLSEVKGAVMDQIERSHFLQELNGKVHLLHYQAVASIKPELAMAIRVAPPWASRSTADVAPRPESSRS